MAVTKYLTNKKGKIHSDLTFERVRRVDLRWEEDMAGAEGAWHGS